MKFKTHLLLILLLALLTPASYAQTRTGSPGSSGNAYGIEPETLYPGALVLELMEAAEEEIDAAAREAFAEGYKAATLRYAPGLEASKMIAESLRTELEAERGKNRFFWPVIGVSTGVSFAAGILLRSFLPR